MSAYKCPVCDYTYNEAKGAAREGFPAGTAWADIPASWCCPDCGVRHGLCWQEAAKILSHPVSSDAEALVAKLGI